uniref:Uncharacterized protein n=1 Tax=Candidatus Kentrum eta TaxID=2126337 RepID=A0A450UA25_9GAMM|nr:MAG: hypothetical protein BECKH772A_GA0070896_1000253 [Candidatus Kentron sp. H]VFJ88866.1 MAG: hypothetical protein BECKH772B_GA0070898_1000249 [Candidatus Kentron sp. H]VFJ95113.1 MAG: hypothetical protein BECKH772C_GA0070978_10001100 [Candidatus Kentron sp. H]
MKMKFSDIPYAFRIEFKEKDAGWALCVIDDKSGFVKDMVMGCPTEEDIEGNPVKINDGLGQNCVDPDAVYEYWNQTFISIQEAYKRSLLLIPSIARDIPGIGAVTFCEFPDTLGDMKQFIEFAATGSAYRKQVACLIDVGDANQTNPENQMRLPEMWKMLDELNHLSHARAIFTRGGWDLPAYYFRFTKVLKDTYKGDHEGLTRRMKEWHSSVMGKPSNDAYQQATKGDAPDCCHNPSNLPKAKPEACDKVLADLVRYDSFGAWRWVREAFQADQRSLDAQRHWLCAKALQTTPLSSNTAPLTAIIGICEGARYLESEKVVFTVESPLAGIPEGKQKGLKKPIDNLDDLGRIQLSDDCSYESFIAALRDWLLQPEQFKTEANNPICRIRIGKTDREAVIEMKYKEPLPEVIFDASPSEREGRVRRAWKELAACAASVERADTGVSLKFDRKI